MAEEGPKYVPLEAEVEQSTLDFLELLALKLDVEPGEAASLLMSVGKFFYDEVEKGTKIYIRRKRDLPRTVKLKEAIEKTKPDLQGPFHPFEDV